MTITECRACDSTKLENILNLGTQHLADFRFDTDKPPAYPLDVVFCDDCKLVQLRDTTPNYEMYHDRYGFKSGVNNTIKADLKDIVEHAQKYVTPTKWLDIASNDGTLLSYAPDVYKVGVDPVGFLCKEAEKHADRIVNDYFDSKHFDEKFNVVTSISCFYDMNDPRKFVSDVCDVLEDDGVWIIQQNYLLKMLETQAVDNICHEHLEYYSLMALENLLAKFGLEVVEVTTSMVNGGVIRTVVGRKGLFEIHESVEKQRQIEKDWKLDTTEPYKAFAESVKKQLRELTLLVKDINNKGEKVYVYGASTRGGTIWQSANLTELDLPYAIERNPAKVGKYMSCIGSEIISEEQARKDNPEYMLVSIWFFKDEVIKREQEYVNNGGKLIFPLPQLEIVDARNISSYL
jgi:NDP-4-keto-2,6-dideoxyhexose 3-C-methyltransferase